MTTSPTLTQTQQEMSDLMGDTLFSGPADLNPLECMLVLQDLMQAVLGSCDLTTNTWLNQDAED